MLGPHARRVLRDVLRLGVDERPAVLQHDDRHLGAGLVARGEVLDALGRVGRVEGMRDAVPREVLRRALPRGDQGQRRP